MFIGKNVNMDQLALVSNFDETNSTDEVSSLTILDLPPELISEILSYLPGKYISVASEACKLFYEACKTDFVWKVRCKNEFGFTDLRNWNCSFKEIYEKVLYRYGCMLGLWQPDRSVYGGLICVRINHLIGRFEGWEYDPPPPPATVQAAMRSRLLFSIGISKGDTLIECHAGVRPVDESCGPHPFQLIMDEEERLCFKCHNPEFHIPKKFDNTRFLNWVQDEYSIDGQVVNFFDQNLYARKYNVFLQHQCEFLCQRIPPLLRTPGAIVQPGLFKGDYSAHGIEVIKLGYSVDMTRLEMFKITGDPNIPARCITMDVDLRSPMILLASQQTDLDMLGEIDLPDLDPGLELDKVPSQPFLVPDGCTREGSPGVPDRCKFRFSALGQVAYSNYKSATFIPAHFVVFDEDTLGFLWIQLRAFCLLKRCTEADLAYS